MKQMKRWITLLLTLAMVVSMTACGTPESETSGSTQEAPVSNPEVQPQEAAPQENAAKDELSREDKELIVNLIGNGFAANMTDDQLQGEIDRLVNDTMQEDPQEKPAPESTFKEDAYDENGAIKVPFDQVYPEDIEEERVKFSGESILIKLHNSTLTDGLKAAGIGALEEIVPLEGSAWYEAQLLEGTDAEHALATVRELKEVVLAEYNYEVQTAALDDYKHFDKEQEEDFKKNGHNKEQWHFHYCGIVDGYKDMTSKGGDPSVVVAVIDSGVDYNHEDLKDNMWVNTKEIPDNGKDDDGNGYIDDYYGVDIIAGKGSGDDTNGHGTHVAGIIAARNNNTGVLGIAYNVKIMSVKAATHSGTLNQADIAKAVLYAYQNGAEVINMSFGGIASSIAVQDALQVAYGRCVLVASAGNDGENNEPTITDPIARPSYPAALSYVLGVMSVDEEGKESSFTNYDIIPFNGVEYELYAPGEQIYSTLPGNAYGYLSGTSMAAPVVSAFAAILRSEYADRNVYPNKFIYGQLASTSDYYAECLHPGSHGQHNIPQIANLENALNNLPKPDVGLQDYAIFDDPKYSAANNGDGVIDAGETIALGMTLRNRWGMSENTLVTIDTLSASSGLADPYITIHNPTVNYGSVGTYSTQDCGKATTDGLLVGWEDPFLITVSKDCPNDYCFTLNVTITCENALDNKDDTLYVTGGPEDPITVELSVRSGVVLPAVIVEDMTLTADNLYIIPNATVIPAGITVRVEPGTHIQFWSDDPKDPYADKYVASLEVNGKLLVEGTKDAPVYIYPSQLMDRYPVEIQTGYSGYTSLKYADVTNLFCDYTYYGNITVAEHCTFRVNYTSNWQARKLSGGSVSAIQLYNPETYILNLKDCVFYKIDYDYGPGNSIRCDEANRCIFVDCGFDLVGAKKNCVFLGNRGVANTFTTSADAHFDFVASQFSVYFREETGTTYIQSISLPDCCLEQLNAKPAILETAEEVHWLTDNLPKHHAYYVGVRYDSQRFVWDDGTPIATFVDPNNIAETASPARPVYFWEGRLRTDLPPNGNNSMLYEIPGLPLPTDITFPKYTVHLDPASTYQLLPVSKPVQLPVDHFVYKSSDESVFTVSSTGLVTPTGLGTADVWVYSADMALKNRVTVTVREYVALETLSFANETLEMAIGELLPANIRLAPANTTRQEVQYHISDPAVVAVENGMLIGKGEGTATVTATCEGLSDTLIVTVYTAATSLQLDSFIVSGSVADGTVALPQVIVNENADTILSWRSTNAAIAAIEDGQLALKSNGIASVIVTDSRSGLSASCLVIVQENSSTVRQFAYAETYNDHLVLLENGDLYVWNTEKHSTPSLITTDVERVAADNYRFLVQKKDGTLELWFGGPNMYKARDYDTFIGRNIADIELNCMYECVWVCTADGNAYALGTVNDGILGNGATKPTQEFSLVNIDGIVDVENGNTTTAFLTNQGQLYATGYLGYTNVATPVLLDTNVAQLLSVTSNGYIFYLKNTSKMVEFSGGSGNMYTTHDFVVAGMEQVAYDNSLISIRDGKAYISSYDGQLTQVPGVSDAKLVYTLDNTFYIATESGLLLTIGENHERVNHMAGVTSDTQVYTPVVIPLTPMATPITFTTSLQDGVLTEDRLTLTFNNALGGAYPKLYADGMQVTVQHAITGYNHLVISRAAGFAEGVSYELVLEAGTVNTTGATNTEEIRIAFTYLPAHTPPVEAPEVDAPVVHKATLDTSVQRVLTPEALAAKLNEYMQLYQQNNSFYGNAILNPTGTVTNPEHWLRLINSSGIKMPLGGNWWGTANKQLIELQIVDFADFSSYGRILYEPYLTEAPQNTFPFATSVELVNKYGEVVSTVGNEQVTFRVRFNRDMDTSIPLELRFGSAYPYGDYEIPGAYVDARTWEGTYTLKTAIENGNQYISIRNGCSASEDLALQEDLGRFGFVIDTTAAQALVMQGTAMDTGVELKWTQDDFATLMGYNVYRSTSEDGLYTRLNKTVIPANTMTFFDDTVEPGKVYYYNFTVVQTDLAESEPSGKIVIMSRDTMAPNIYHSPVANAFTGANLVLNATVTDNLNIAYANLYYRIAGTDAWSIIRMNKLNDAYSAIIPAAFITTAGVEYYIDAFDGVSHTYKGAAEEPYIIAVQEAIDTDSVGDVDGDGVVTNLDALLLLYAINDKYNLDAAQFARADLNGDGKLQAVEALQILRYVSGAAGSLKM